MKKPVAATAALSLALFVLYALLAARDVMFGDGPELTAAAITNGVAHPPGYPLWIVLAHLASLVPVGTLAYRVNLTACAFHALAAGCVFATAYALTRRMAAALFAALALGLGSPIFFSWSLQAEVFSLDDLLAAAIVLLCALWLDAPGRLWPLVALGAAFGLGLANQQSLILLAPLPAWAAACNRRALPPRARLGPALGVAALAFVAGFVVPYGHTLLASQHLSGWHLGAARTPAELVDVIDRRVFGTFELVPDAVDRGGTALDRVSAMLEADGWPALAIAVGCAGFAARRRLSQLGLAALIVAFPFFGFCAVAGIAVSDESLRAIFQRFALLSLTASAPFASGVYVLFDALPWRALRVAAALLAPLGCVAAGVVEAPQLSLADVHDARTLYRDIARALPPRAILLTAGDSVDGPPLYFGPIEGWRPDVTVIAYGQLGLAAYRAALAPEVAIPALAGAALPAPIRRDLIASANATRAFFVTGERGIHAPGPRFRPRIDGIVSRMAEASRPIDAAGAYRLAAALQSAPGYGAIDADRWRSNGFGPIVREYYAGGFFSTGYAAERLGDLAAARFWYEAARAYSADPLIAERLAALGPGR